MAMIALGLRHEQPADPTTEIAIGIGPPESKPVCDHQ